MFEEVPQTRRGLARWTARRVVLGPFAVGGGMLLATLGGSVAVAATVITASNLHAAEVRPHPAPHPAPVSAGSAAPSGRATAAPAAGTRSRPGSAAATLAAPPVVSPGSAQPSATRPPTTTPGRSAVPAPTPPASTGSSAAGAPTSNALVYLVGYDPNAQRLRYQYAVAVPGPGGTVRYRISSVQQYSAGLAPDVVITSGERLCPPAGQTCSTAQLIAAAGSGLFAEVAIDPFDLMHAVHEVDNPPPGFGTAAPSPSSSPTAGGTATPSAVAGTAPATS